MMKNLDHTFNSKISIDLETGSYLRSCYFCLDCGAVLQSAGLYIPKKFMSTDATKETFWVNSIPAIPEH